MTTTTMQPTVETQVQTTALKTARLFFVDHWRAGLAILVVLHHLALVYGGIPPFYYFEPPFTEPLAYLTALVFVLFNQAWFMGAFFMLAGYFTPGSYNRKGRGAFLRSRVIRLGVPMLLFYFVLNPLASIGFFLMPAELTGITNPLTWAAYPFLLGLGPLWFVAMLLIFNIGYTIWRMVTGNRPKSDTGEANPPSYLWIGVFILGLAVASYLIRMVIPLGRSVGDLPTLAYLPQYLSFFILGIVASRRGWFRSIPGSMGVIGFVVAFLAAVILFPLAISGELLSLAFTEVSLNNAFGLGGWQSAVYALWDSVFAVGLVLGYLVFFRGFLNGESWFGRLLSQQSYGVYIFHIPIIVFLAYALRGIALPALFKFGLAAVIIVPVCFLVAYLVRRIPLASQVI